MVVNLKSSTWYKQVKDHDILQESTFMIRNVRCTPYIENSSNPIQTYMYEN